MSSTAVSCFVSVVTAVPPVSALIMTNLTYLVRYCNTRLITPDWNGLGALDYSLEIPVSPNVTYDLGAQMANRQITLAQRPTGMVDQSTTSLIDSPMPVCVG